MARNESQALAGFYPAPLSIIQDVARRLRPGSSEVLLDPCAGQGEALLAVAHALLARIPKSSYKGRPDLDVYAVELEAERHAVLASSLNKAIGWQASKNAIHGDGFMVEAGPRLASVLYLNPPYDLDPEHGRLESRWLQRWLPALCDGGVLLFLVPFYALGACADTLARGCDEVTCWRFPDEHEDPAACFDLFKQVMLVGRRSADTLLPRPDVAALVRGWSEAGTALPTITEAPEVLWTGTGEGRAYNPRWRLGELDLGALAHRVQPWSSERKRTGRGLVADRHLETAPADGLLGPRRFPVAVPLRPSHLGAALASGVFHGAHLRPDDPADGLPEVLVKGVFARTWAKQSDKRDKDGAKVGEVQVQTPELRVAALDLSTGQHHDLKSGVFPTGATRLSDFTVADLLERYRTDLRQHLTDACPPLHDPARPEDAFALPRLARPLYPAQADAVRACLRLLGGPHVGLRERRNRAAILLGEVGVGKTPCALAVALASGARRPLVVCPPHLVASWAEQAGIVLPAAHVHVLRDVTDLDRWAEDTRPGMHLGLLSREGAKLGHRLAGVTGGQCPRCGAPLGKDADPDKLASTRATCQAQSLRPAGRIGRAVAALATALLPLLPDDGLVREWAEGASVERRAAGWMRRTEDQRKAQRAEHVTHLRRVAGAQIESVLRQIESPTPRAYEAEEVLTSGLVSLCRTLAPLPADGLTDAEAEADRALGAVVDRLWTWAAGDTSSWSARTSEGRKAALSLVALRSMASAHAQIDAMKARAPSTSIVSGQCGWQTAIKDTWAQWFKAGDEAASAGDPTSVRLKWLALVAPKAPAPIDAVGHARAALGWLARAAARTQGEPCGEPLYAATPEPRRVPLSDRLVRRHRGAVDFLILDEAHELATSGAAQEKAAHRLMHLGVPTLLLTGSLMNGYADSLFTHFWSLSPEFRAEFPREAQSAFVAAYGYQKRLVEQTDKDKKKVVWGTQSDREETMRIVGDAPGVSPLFVVRYLLRHAVTLHKGDLAVSLPPCTDELVGVTADRDLEKNYEHLSKKLLDAIKKERFTHRGAALWGQLADLPSYLDRATADVGNGHSETEYEIRWPESLTNGDMPDPLAGTVVASVPLLPATTITTKEQWMLDTVRSELDAGRPCLVFGWHIALLPRLVRLLESHLGEKVALLRADKVPAAKRQDWINEQVLKPGRRVMVTNPKAVETGLNNLVRFATQVWMQSPACNPTTYRQAVGRVHRIGQKQATRILFPVYRGTSQAMLHTLLTQKVAVSLAVDGLDASSALAAAGAGAGEDETDGLRHLDVGQALYRLLTKESA